MIPEPASRPKAPRLVGGAPCLDFVNTVGYRGREDGREERLPDYAALVDWAERVGILEAQEASQARAAALADPARADAVVAEARDLREAIARLFQGRPRPDDLVLVNGHLAQAPRAALVRHGAGFGWGTDTDTLRAPLWPVLWNAADLMAGAERDRVRAAAPTRNAVGCSWTPRATARACGARWTIAATAPRPAATTFGRSGLPDPCYNRGRCPA
jgi:predicted RNA-binding Zn ribbon-like protein